MHGTSPADDSVRRDSRPHGWQQPWHESDACCVQNLRRHHARRACDGIAVRDAFRHQGFLRGARAAHGGDGLRSAGGRDAGDRRAPQSRSGEHRLLPHGAGVRQVRRRRADPEGVGGRGRHDQCYGGYADPFTEGVCEPVRHAGRTAGRGGAFGERNRVGIWAATSGCRSASVAGGGVDGRHAHCHAEWRIHFGVSEPRHVRWRVPPIPQAAGGDVGKGDSRRSHLQCLWYQRPTRTQLQRRAGAQPDELHEQRQWADCLLRVQVELLQRFGLLRKQLCAVLHAADHARKA